MEPIISPWLIYLIGIADSVRQTANMLAFVSSLCFLLCLGFYVYHAGNSLYADGIEKEADIKIAKASQIASKFMGGVFIVTLLLSVFVPSKQVLISMAVANIVTVDNIKGANDFVKSNVQDYVNMIVEAVNKVK